MDELAEILKTQAHTLGNHGLSEAEFYGDGLFRGVIERIRGQYAASMGDKRDFVRLVLNHMQDREFITEWESSGDENRHDYSIALPDGRIAVVELKGCLDGNNTNIFERPPQANEFVIWSVCSNVVADPRHNVWSGIHTRLSSEIIDQKKQVDGVIVWDWVCGSAGRVCPKLAADPTRATIVGQHALPPPCIYLLPATIPNVRHNPDPAPHTLAQVGFLGALHECFGGSDDELHFVRFAVAHRGSETVRRTTITRNGVVEKESKQTAIRRR